MTLLFSLAIVFLLFLVEARIVMTRMRSILGNDAYRVPQVRVRDTLIPIPLKTIYPDELVGHDEIVLNRTKVLKQLYFSQHGKPKKKRTPKNEKI